MSCQALSGDLSCHGIQARPAVGYLSALEALRYCEVGGYYKTPRFPIWVVGSTSHFSVLFGDEVSEGRGAPPAARKVPPSSPRASSRLVVSPCATALLEGEPVRRAS